MNRPRIATVLSAREWEPRFVDVARRDPTIRIVRRAYEAQDLERAAPLDGVVVGSETSWITSTLVRSIRRSGTRVIGVYPAGDAPGRDLLHRGGADVALPDSTLPEDLLNAATLVAMEDLQPDRRGRLIAVTGPRGAPGRTEVAVSLAQVAAERTRTAIIDLDTEAPGVAFRLGLSPGPGLLDITETLRATDRLVASRAPGWGDLTVIGGPARVSPEAAMRLGTADLLESVLAAFDVVVADVGPWSPGHAILAASDEIVLVCEAQPVSVIRAAGLVRDWEGPTPSVVVNRVNPGHTDDTLRIIRRALGLEPHTLIPNIEAPLAPETSMLRDLLTPLGAEMVIERAVEKSAGRPRPSGDGRYGTSNG
ncbi:MAG: hypothetical protein OEX97_04405 [Acidimicrobiia bacterium]|nr:hypothetical protein [Acidimicrobiia bacterium]